MLLRLDRIISERTQYSRREIKSMAADGRITVDGAPVRDTAQKFDPEQVRILVAGQELPGSSLRYFMMNKPQGVISATEYRREKTVLDLLPPELMKLGLSPAGRLDKDAEGLLILSNDGDYVHAIISPKRHVWKQYHVTSSGVFVPGLEEEFEQGLVLDDGLVCLPARLERLSEHEAYVFVREGKFHQVKRMCASVGCPVTALLRVAVGGLRLNAELMPGEFREMSAEEAKTVFD